MCIVCNSTAQVHFDGKLLLTFNMLTFLAGVVMHETVSAVSHFSTFSSV